MRINELRVSGYRSLRDIRMRLRDITVVVGANGSGKSNLYRSLNLLSEAALGRFAPSLAQEGGMHSVYWAGVRRRGLPRIAWSLQIGDWNYEFAFGFPEPTQTPLFCMDPWIKEEKLTLVRHRNRPIVYLEREGPSATLRDADGQRVTYPFEIGHTDTTLGVVRDSERFPHLDEMRRQFESWRFYHQFRVDAESPLRQPQVGVTTPVLSHDGRDLGAALHTIRGIGDGALLDWAIDRAFPKWRLEIEQDDHGRVHLALAQSGVNRPMEAHELSDGTLRYLCLVAALLTPRPPAFLALNEPETSLHPDLLGPLACLIAHAGKHAQVWVTTHARELADAIAAEIGQAPMEVELVEGETKIVGQGLLD